MFLLFDVMEGSRARAKSQSRGGVPLRWSVAHNLLPAHSEDSAPFLAILHDVSRLHL